LDITKKVGILKVEGDVSSEISEQVAAEHKLGICVNGQYYTDLACTPQHLEELALGNLYSSGMIGSLADVRQSETENGNGMIRIETVCGNSPLIPVQDGLFIRLAEIRPNMEQFLKESEMFFSTGAVHSCALISGGRLLHFMEDIGRHNAFDKTVGAALRNKTQLEQAVVLTSGRLPADMMIKVIYSRVQVVVSRSAPTSEAVELASRYNVTLCGFARGNRINIYTGRHRIIF